MLLKSRSVLVLLRKPKVSIPNNSKHSKYLVGVAIDKQRTAKEDEMLVQAKARSLTDRTLGLAASSLAESRP